MKYFAIALLILATACRQAPPNVPEGKLTEDEYDHMVMHNEIWDLIGLSDRAALELNGIVLRLLRNIKYNQIHHPELMKILPGRMPPQANNYGQYIENHRSRFLLLDISEETQEELLNALAWVWRALHDEESSPDEKRRAEEIRTLMVPELPPCQHQSIFKRGKDKD